MEIHNIISDISVRIMLPLAKSDRCIYSYRIMSVPNVDSQRESEKRTGSRGDSLHRQRTHVIWMFSKFGQYKLMPIWLSASHFCYFPYINTLWFTITFLDNCWRTCVHSLTHEVLHILRHPVDCVKFVLRVNVINIFKKNRFKFISQSVGARGREKLQLQVLLMNRLINTRSAIFLYQVCSLLLFFSLEYI